MNLPKKIIARVLTLVMVLGLIPQTVFAQETAASPLQHEALQEVNEDKTKVVANQNDELNVDIQLKGATFFDGDPFWGTTQTILEHNKEVPYNGWQLMQLTVEIPYQDGLEITSIEPSAESIYPEYSEIKKDDKNSKWTYTFYFYDNGTYNFTINYSLNGTEHSVTKAYTVEGLVPIKDVAMRRHLINNYGEFTGLSYQGGQYVTKDILAKEPNVGFFTFGLDGDNGRTAENTTSLDGLQYLKNATGLYLHDCKKLVKGETIEPVTQGYYPNMKRFRVSDINARPLMPTHAYNAELVTKSIANMPALTELVINGTGFSDCSVFKEIKEGNLSYLQAMANNIVDLNGIESQPNLSSVNIGQNQIKSIELLSKLNDINFVNLTRNQVFDLRPLNKSLNKDAVAGGKVKGFAATEQTITYDKTVITLLENDSYKVELPMPIDIDGTLTDTAEVTVEYGNGNSKVYNTTKSDGKTYISIPQNDVNTSDENPFKDAEFTFSFNNNKGTDARTKSWFTGTVSFKASPIANEYRVIYDFISGTRGKALPPEVTALLPEDSNKYSEGDTINAIQPGETKVAVTDGVWTFKGYDADSKIASETTADEDRNIKFTGTWEFELNSYSVNYSFKSTNEDEELPIEIKDQLPTAGSVKHGSTVTAPDTTFDDVEVTDGVWTFKGWTPERYENVTDNVEFVGTWEFKRNASMINRVPTINASDKTLTVGDEFDPLKEVTATDEEDGDIPLTIENVIENGVNTSEAGVYEVTYKVTDSQGASSIKTIYVTVNPKMEGLNQIPTIDARDKTITVGDEFDPLKDVTATDKEDGDLTSVIEVLKNEVNTTKAGTYEVTYKVTDRQGASSVKTIKVTVKAKDTPSVPSEPNKPNDLNKPVVPNASVSDKTPETGDSTNMTLWILLVMVSGISVLGLYRRKRQINQHKR